MAMVSERIDLDMHTPPVNKPVAFRAVSLLFGASLLLAALGLWLVPGSNWSPEVMLIKLGLSGLFVVGGAGFLQAGIGRRG